MNRKNMQRAIDFLEKNSGTIKLDMSRFRAPGEHIGTSCKSVGCIIGYCTALDSARIKKDFLWYNGNIEFDAWSAEFFGLEFRSKAWDYCFSGMWADHPTVPEEEKTGTLEQALVRMKNLLKLENLDHFDYEYVTKVKAV